MIRRNILLASSFVGVFIGLGQAHAQQAATSASGTTVGEVVVTAQRRSERLIDVPITVAAVSGAQLQQRGVTSVLGLQRMTAGLQMPFYGAFLAPSIRGISANGTTAGAPTNVALYLDGVYQPSQSGSLLDLPDIQDIEVLKGPQGTLYGQNAEGGAIVINTLEPKFRWQGKASISYGNYNDVRFLGYETGPITDSIAQSLSVGVERHDGFRTSIVNGQRDPGLEQELVRLKLLFQPNDKESITFTAFYSWHFDSGIFAGEPYKDQTVAYPLNPGLISKTSNPHYYSTTGSNHNDVMVYGADLKGVFDLGLGKLTWLSSFEATRLSIAYDLSWSPYWIATSLAPSYGRSVIEEGNFVSKPIGPIEFTTGVFYEHLEDAINPDFFTAYNFGNPDGTYLGAPGCCVLSPAAAPAHPYVSNPDLFATRDVLAGYLEGTLHVTSNLIVTLGGRYSTDTMHAWFDGSCNFQQSNQYVAAAKAGMTPSSTSALGVNYAACANGINPGPNYVITELQYSPTSWNNFSPRATIRYKLTPSSNVYFSYSQGFRSGTLNSNGLVAPPVKPETLDAYEGGYKGTLFNRLTLGVAAFYYQYKNKQESIYIAPTYIMNNAASAHADGVDLDATFVATPQLSFNASVEWLEATFDTYGAKGCSGYDGSGCAQVYVPDGITHGMDAVFQNLSHRQMERAPKWSGTVTADYHVDTTMGRFTANASVYYSSKTDWDENGWQVQDPYATLDMELGFAPAAEPHMRFVLWGKNLTDAAYFQSAIEQSYGAGETYSPPRQFGARFEYKF